MGDVPAAWGLTFLSLEVYAKYEQLKCEALRNLIRSLRAQPYPDGITKFIVPRDPDENILDLREIWSAYWTEACDAEGQLFTVEYFCDAKNAEIVITGLDVA